jgi:hypothetical protein
VSSFGSAISLISAFLFIIILVEMFYSKRPFGRSWEDDSLPRKLKFCLVRGGKSGFLKDAPLPYQLTFQDPATATMEGIIDLHHEILFYIIIIITFIF